MKRFAYRTRAARHQQGIECIVVFKVSAWCKLRSRLQAAGVCPMACRKCLHKCAWSVKPQRSAMSLKDASVVSMY
jgi:hypothetical protein